MNFDNILSKFSQKEFLPVIAAVITVFLILFFRPRFLVNQQKGTPRSFLVTLVVLLVSAGVYWIVV